MKITVTGAAGFIGSSLSEKLVELGHTVIGIDNFDPFYDRKVKEINLSALKDERSFDFYECDITSLSKLQSVIADDTDVIVHLAAKAGVRPSILNPNDYLNANAQGTLNLLEIARQNGISKFVFASSSSVYGKNPNVPWIETLDLQPISPYAASKIAGESLGQVYSHLYGIKFIALRFFTVYGPRQRPDLAIHKFFRKIYSGESIEMFGEGDTCRDYTYIDDTLSGIISAINLDPKQNYDCFNLGNSYQISLKQLITEIEKVTGIKAKIIQKPEQAGDVRVTYADISKSKGVLGYDPQTQLRSGLWKFDEWFRNHNTVLKSK